MSMVDQRRVLMLKNGVEGDGAVVYWMSRDQRAEDNWALLFAQEQALARRRPLTVVFALAPAFGHAALRHYTFMFQGLKHVEKRLREKNIGFVLLKGDPREILPVFVRNINAALMVILLKNPLRIRPEERLQRRDDMARKHRLQSVLHPASRSATKDIAGCRHEGRLTC